MVLTLCVGRASVLHSHKILARRSFNCGNKALRSIVQCTDSLAVRGFERLGPGGRLGLDTYGSVRKNKNYKKKKKKATSVALKHFPRVCRPRERGRW